MVNTFQRRFSYVSTMFQQRVHSIKERSIQAGNPSFEDVGFRAKLRHHLWWHTLPPTGSPAEGD